MDVPFHSRNAPIRATQSAEDDPSPVPGRASYLSPASKPCSTPNLLATARTNSTSPLPLSSSRPERRDIQLFLRPQDQFPCLRSSKMMKHLFPDLSRLAE